MTTHALEGRQLGSYRVIERIGEGGMGAVYLAEHVDIGRRAALKVLRAELAHDKQQAARFLGEARATNRIGHSGIVDIYDCGHDADVGLYLVMELLEGETLASRLARDPRPPLAWVADITHQLARALDAAHAAGVVHRDLKPDNIFIVTDDEQRERVKILDFGIAKLASGGAAHTHTGQVLGTPLYMSPEQCHGAKHVDARGDVYSLGAVVYCMLAGQPPFVGTGIGQIIAKHLSEPPPPLCAVRPDISPLLEQPVLAALAKQPEQRPQTPTELAERISAALAAAHAPTESQQMTAQSSTGDEATLLAPTLPPTASSPVAMAAPLQTPMPPAARARPPGSAKLAQSPRRKVSRGLLVVGAVVCLVLLLVAIKRGKKRADRNARIAAAAAGSASRLGSASRSGDGSRSSRGSSVGGAPSAGSAVARTVPVDGARARGLLRLASPRAQIIGLLAPKRLLAMPGFADVFRKKLALFAEPLRQVGAKLHQIERLLYILPKVEQMSAKKDAPALVAARGLSSDRVVAFAKLIKWRASRRQGFVVFDSPGPKRLSLAVLGGRTAVAGQRQLVQGALSRARATPTVAADLLALDERKPVAALLVRRLTAQQRQSLAKDLHLPHRRFHGAVLAFHWDGSAAEASATLITPDVSSAIALRDAVRAQAAQWLRATRGPVHQLLATARIEARGANLHAVIRAPRQLVPTMLGLLDSSRKK